MPKIWGLHNYSDVNRLESWRTRELVRALGGDVWLTETGGIVQFGGAFPNKHGSGLTRSAKVLKYMFAVAGSNPRIRRLYIYDWTGGNSHTRFDAGLMNAHDQPRPGLCGRVQAATRGALQRSHGQELTRFHCATAASRTAPADPCRRRSGRAPSVGMC